MNEPCNSVLRDAAAGYFKVSRAVWRVLLVSVPFDLLLVLLPSTRLNFDGFAAELEKLAVLLLVAALTGLFRIEILSFVFNRHWPTQLKQEWVLKLLVAFALIAVILAAFLSVESLFQFGIELIAPAIVIVLSVYSFYKSFAEAVSKMSGDGADQPRSIKASFYVILATLFAGRLISPLGFAAVYLSGGTIMEYLPYFASSYLLLLQLAPEQSEFIAVCKHCASVTAQAAIRDQACLECQLRKA